MDYGERYTENQLAEIEKRTKSIYEEAGQDMTRKLQEFNNAHKARDAKYRAAVEAGEMSKADYQAWLQGQVFQGEQWKKKREQMAQSLFNANTSAMSIVNGSRFDVFAENANFTSYKLCRDVGANLSFGLYDRSTVQRLIKDEPDVLPPYLVNRSKDMAWNMKKITRAVTQSIIQGEGIDKLAGRIADVTGTSQKAMMLQARTAMTGAQNAGRIQSMKDAEALGINVKKQWMATLDNRTRDAHQDLDGQVQEVDKPFSSILGDIMFPGDPDAAEPANVKNCRCTLLYVIDDKPFSGERRDNVTGEDIEYMTYREWKAGKMKEGQVDNAVEFVLPGVDSERSKIAVDTIGELNGLYPLRNKPLSGVYSFRHANGLPADADLIDFTDEHTEWEGVGAIYYPITTEAKNGPLLEGPHIVLYDYEEAGTEPFRDLLSTLADIREKGGWHSSANSFFNTGIGAAGQLVHEYGHALSEDCGMYWGGKHYEELRKIFDKYSAEELGRYISKYAATNEQEMFAEAFVASFEPRLRNPVIDEIMELFYRLRGK